MASLNTVNKKFIDKYKEGLLNGTITKSNIKEDIGTRINFHRLVISTYEKLDEPFEGSSIIKEIKKRLKTPGVGGEGEKIYKALLNKLDRKPQAAEGNSPLSSVMEINKIFVNLLDTFHSKIDTLIPVKTINIHNLKLSYIVLLGLLDESRIISTFSTYLINLILNDKIEAIIKQPKYKSFFLKGNLDEFARMVNDIFNNTGPVSFFQTIAKMKALNTDYLLLNSDDKSNLDYVSTGPDTKGLVQYLDFFVAVPNPFKVLGSGWNRMQNFFYNIQVEERDWLDSQIELYKLQMADIPDDDPRIIQLKKVIKAYEEMISKRKREIAAFEQKI